MKKNRWRKSKRNH